MPAVKQQKSGYVKGVKGIVITGLLETGAADVTAVAHGIKTAQKASIEVQYEEGEKSTLRGGDSILCVVEDSDTITGVTMKFTNAKFDADATLIIQGGTLIQDDTDPDSPITIGWEAPMTADAKPNPFKAEIYARNYNSSGIVDGYVKVTVPYCTGKMSSLAYADNEWSTPEFEIKGKENSALSMGCYRKEFVAALPTELS